MKKSIIIAAIAALTLVSCHQPTKEEQQMDNVKEAVIRHAQATLAYPKGAEITEVKIDTLSSLYNSIKFVNNMHSLRPDEDPWKLIEIVDEDFAKEIRKAEAKIPADTVGIENRYYCAASVTVRHTASDGKTKKMTLYIAAIQDGSVKGVRNSDVTNDRDELIEFVLPKDEATLMKASFMFSDLLKILN